MYLDEVRSLAIMLVVIGHISRLFSYDFYSWLFCSGVFSLTRIGVPLFFTVSGSLLLTRKYEVKKFLYSLHYCGDSYMALSTYNNLFY